MVEEIEEYSREALESLKKSMAFIKTFNENQFDTIYSEREWRSVTSFNFTWKDVDSIVLSNKYELMSRFDMVKKKLKIPKAVNIIAWEDISK